jgi:two-component system sensor histidine kinase VicK
MSDLVVMLQSFMAVPLHFTIEFLGFLITAGGAGLVLTRPALIPGSAFNRFAASLGFALLAATQVAHGGAFLESDGADLLVAGRTLGLVMILVGLVGALGAARGPSAAVAFSIKKPLLIAPAGAAVLLALTAFTASAREGGRALRRLGLAALFLAVAEVLTSSVPGVRFSATTDEPFAYAGHGAKAIAFVFLGSWLWAGIRSSIRTRFVASFVTLLVVVVLVLSSALTGVISNNVQDDELNRVGAQLRNAAEILETRGLQDVLSKTQAAAETLSGAPGSLTRAQAASLRAGFDLGFVMFAQPNAGLIAYSGAGPYVNGRDGDPRSTAMEDPDAFAILGWLRSDVVRAGAPKAASAQPIDDAVALLAAVQIGGSQSPAGFLVAGQYVDALEMEKISQSAASAFATIMIDRKVVASSLPCDDIPGGQILTRAEATALVTEGELTLQRDICNKPYFSAVRQLHSASNVPVATLVLSSPASLVAQTREAFTRILFLVAIGIGAVALLLAWLSGRRITRPIQALTETAREVREGDLNVKARVVGDDEVGQLGETFNEMTTSLLRMTNDLREAAREEHRLRGRIETIIQSMADGLVAVDADKNILAFNREAEQLIGVESSKAMGRPVEEVIRTRDPQGQELRLPIYDLAVGSVAGAFIERDGSTIPVAVTCAVLRAEDGELAGGVAVLRNMTREREIERMKSEFLSNISHELRTPLTPIKGYAEILGRKDIPTDKAQQFAKGILESTGRLERIVELLVDFSAMEAGRLSPRTTPVDVGDLLAKVAEQAQGKTSRHRLIVESKARLPKVLGDERLLRRSLEEILDNAIKFSPDGGTIRLEARGASAGNGAGRRNVEISITDEGIGIPTDDLHKIFSDFHQLDGSETRTYGGLGLGLAFVQRIIEAHAGSIDVQSEPDEGTRFTVTIPAATRAKAPAPAAATVDN